MLLPAVALLAPTLEQRWLYLQTNLLPVASVDRAISILERAAKVGYNGVVLADSKIARLDNVPDGYTVNAKRFCDAARRLKIEVIPSVLGVGWADGMLSHDVNLIEAQPIRGVEYRFQGITARPVPTVKLVNGGLEEANGDKLVGWNLQDGPGVSSFREPSPKGGMAVRMESFVKGNEGGNCRLSQVIDVKPWHQYRMQAWMKTQDLDGSNEVRMMALDSNGKPLLSQDIAAQRTEDWRRVTVVFNSQANAKVRVYWGIWGGRGGKLWWDGLTVEDAGLLNVVRRPGAPLKAAGIGGPLREGVDFEPVSDPLLGKRPWDGEYTFDQDPPLLRRKTSGSIRDSDVVTVDAYHAVTTDQGKSAICPSEPATRRIEERELAEVSRVFGPDGLLLSLDELRVANWCGACAARKSTPGAIFAEEINNQVSMARKASPRARLCFWSDMFDPAHNAVDGYYLSNGTWSGSWKGLPKDALVLNWNHGGRAKSLPFFAGLGLKQVLAGYYDGNVEDIKTWLADAKAVKGVTGVMYTTWTDNYSNIEAFAKAAWGA
ncbi:hypothetical protein EON82_13695 [bacterium]|nr:MAG: hypothetical protein EON82_13695 [bacterium]